MRGRIIEELIRLRRFMSGANSHIQELEWTEALMGYGKEVA